MLPPGTAGPAPGPAGDRRAGARRADVLGVVRTSRQGLGIRALAEATGLHENTVRFHLDRLVADGLVERRTGASRGPGRPPLTFVARRDHHGAGRDNYELLARVLAAYVGTAEDPVAAARAAGQAWGRAHAAAYAEAGPDEGRAPDGIPADPWERALDALAQVLDRAGFAPALTPAPAGATVRVHHCPFLRLAREDRVVPCAVHLGLMDGVLEALGPVGTVERLEPFVTPSLCVAHLRASVPGART